MKFEPPVRHKGFIVPYFATEERRMHWKRTFIGAVSSGASRALFFGGDGDLDGGSQLLD